VVVNLDVIAERRFQFGGAAETGLIDDLANAAIEALHHAIGLRMAWGNKAMLDLKLLAQTVEHMLPAGLFLLALAGEAIGELAAIVGEQFLDFDRTGGLYFGKKVDTAALGLISVDFDVDPPGCPVDGDKQIASRRLVWHLWQVLDVDVQKARLVVLEGLLGGRGAALLLHQVAQVRYAMTTQAAPQASARDGRIDELTRDSEQVVRRQQERPAQFHDDELLVRRQGRTHRLRAMGAIRRAFTILPFSDRLSGDVVKPGQLGLR
jgi:hypothetical protein